MKDVPLTREHILEIQRAAEHFIARQERARARLERDKTPAFYLALVGYEARMAVTDLAVGHIRPIIDPPGEQALAAAMLKPGYFGAVGRYVRHASHELVMDRAIWNDDAIAMSIAGQLLSLLRIRSRSEFFVPAVSDRSWSTVEGFTDHSCDIRLLEDAPAALYASTRAISTEDSKWTAEHFEAHMALAANGIYSLAAEALVANHLVREPRLRIASLWSGIEGVLGIQSELRFRIGALLASLLTERGPQRRQQYKRVLKLYDVRSKAVHGSAISAETMIEHIADVRELLASLLCLVVERGKLPSTDELEIALFA